MPYAFRTRVAALLLATCAAVMLLFGCSDYCSTCPACSEPEPEPVNDKPYDGRLYVTMLSGDVGMYVFDLATDSLIDSVMYKWGMGPVDVSPDGKYVAVDATGDTRIYDVSDMHLMHTIRDLIYADFIRNGTALIGTGRGYSYLYSFPDCQPEWKSCSTPWGGYVYSDERDELISLKYPDTLFTYSLATHTTGRRCIVSSGKGGWQVTSFDVNPAGTMFYGIANSPNGSQFFIFDLEKDTIVSTFSMCSALGDVKLSPKRNEVYVSDPGLPGYQPSPATIYIFDTETGEYLNAISLYGYGQETREYPLAPFELTVAPDGNWLFVQARDLFTMSGALLFVNTSTRRVEKTKFLNDDRQIWYLAVGPKP